MVHTSLHTPLSTLSTLLTKDQRQEKSMIFAERRLEWSICGVIDYDKPYGPTEYISLLHTCTGTAHMYCYLATTWAGTSLPASLPGWYLPTVSQSSLDLSRFFNLIDINIWRGSYDVLRRGFIQTTLEYLSDTLKSIFWYTNQRSYF